ncbi:glycosyltransferase 61 family protein [Algoriphagus persicinus]|uniref:glycosyltransferase 61 family protein n=1 Tax=Algoriphagus persicinus TaxID=3108754 RepID=UPI002B3A1A19|nr:glycosyltransferase 61 family protein [Algoriphagus sp. E1-3-M2]MEB2786436.1 glycosyltransferase 61 family protein [Algoriphagus sp. E1-3-M2]
MELIEFKANPDKEGDLGNYWHYTFGYFIPVTTYLLQQKNEIKHKSLVFDSCNLLMDKHLRDFLTFHKFSFSFKDFGDKSIKPALHAYKSNRKKIWRKFMRWEYKIRGENASYFIVHSFKKKGNSVIVPRWDEYLRLYFDFPPNLKLNFAEYKEKMIGFAQVNACCDPHLGKDKLLILSRAPKPQFISSDALNKNRWFSGYGNERRTLNQVEEGIEQLSTEGYDCLSYEPGSHNLACQINHFSKCSGIIGVRGAEFANMVWMKENAIVILFRSADFNNTPLQRELISPINLVFHEIAHNGQNSPTFDTKEVLIILKKHEDLFKNSQISK